MEVSALTHKTMPGLSGPSALLRLQSDERLIAMTRRGQHAAFEVLFSRYQSRLLAFCRHMLSSREDAEDVLQEVFTAAFNAVLADEREINVRPWLYRIARNRSLNHLRRASAIGVDSMDVHYADNGLSTGERVLRRESFRQLLGDVKELPETQRTALLLREIDALSYEQIADAMETTVPSVKSLLVRARISLAEAAEARQLSCEEVRLALGEMAEGLIKLGAPARRHVRGCERCRSFKRQLRENNHVLAAIFPVGTLFLAKKLLLTKLGTTASAGHVGAGAGATAGASASVAGAGGAGTAGGILTAGAGAVATKAVAGLAAAAIVTAVATSHVGHPAHRHHAGAATTAYVSRDASEPIVMHASVQPVSSTRQFAADPSAVRRLAHTRPTAKTAKIVPPVAVAHPPTSTPPANTPPTNTPPTTPAPIPPKPTPASVTQVTTETTALPTNATATPPQPAASSAPVTYPTGGTPSPPAEPAPAEPTPPTETAPPTETTPPPPPPPPPPTSPPTLTAPVEPPPTEPGPRNTPPVGGTVESTSPAVTSQTTPQG
ncbi:MAG TPA: sigma-70 family RNA polymerase sigma factor [Solirubrobacteraceae bacterium]|nr:sigma-70 family RNA polymerase sigma factor [Solirubrobacteraceae bacterium]